MSFVRVFGCSRRDPKLMVRRITRIFQWLQHIYSQAKDLRLAAQSPLHKIFFFSPRTGSAPKKPYTVKRCWILSFAGLLNCASRCVPCVLHKKILKLASQLLERARTSNARATQLSAIFFCSVCANVLRVIEWLFLAHCFPKKRRQS